MNVDELKKDMQTWSFQAKIEWSMLGLRQYVEVSSEAFLAAKSKHHEFVQSQITEWPEIPEEKIREQWSLDTDAMVAEFPSLLSRANFLTIYSAFEHHLLMICWRIQKIKACHFGPQDLKGGFAGAEPFILRTVGVKICGAAYPTWESIQFYRQIRNVVAHQGGHLRKGADSKLRDCVEATDGLRLHDDRIVFSTEFCYEEIATVESHLKQLVQSINEKLESNSQL